MLSRLALFTSKKENMIRFNTSDWNCVYAKIKSSQFKTSNIPTPAERVLSKLMKADLRISNNLHS